MQNITLTVIVFHEGKEVLRVDASTAIFGVRVFDENKENGSYLDKEIDGVRIIAFTKDPQ